ncbi:SRPBCC family protein [Roseiarcus sp.]|uniref:SRPBCC family protein n=1 Tax=Roseiarcus sp. TaxID=1969460 RepID=UPI003F94F9BB
MSYEIKTEIGIEASPSRVWEVLTDFPRYPEWNPFVLEVQGDVYQGAAIHYRFEMPRGIRIRTAAVVLRFQPDSELRFSAHFLAPTVFRGDHYFAIESKGQNSVVFHHGEIISGFLFPPVQLILQTQGPPIFQALNKALKRRAEQPP